MKWISVEDRLPEDNIAVLVVCNGIANQWHKILARYTCPEYGFAVWIDSELNEYDAIVTHWMPLPTPPAKPVWRPAQN